MSTRRHFLALCAALSACALTERPTGPVSAGKVSDFGVGYLGFLANQALLVGRDAGGFYCLSAFCSFDDVDMSVDGELTGAGLTCDGCNSLFDRNGAVKRSPATRPLDHFLVTIDGNGEVIVDPSKPVDIAARTPLPGASPDATP